MLTREWNNRVKHYLQKGGTVLLLADTAQVKSDVPPCFSSISWNAVWSGTPPNTLGMLLDHTTYEFKPLVQIIPDWNNNRKIGLIFEAKVDKGKLMVTSIAFDRIMAHSPVARQMYYSLVNYLNSPDFSPEVTLTNEMIDKIFIQP